MAGTTAYRILGRGYRQFDESCMRRCIHFACGASLSQPLIARRHGASLVRACSLVPLCCYTSFPRSTMRCRPVVRDGSSAASMIRDLPPDCRNIYPVYPGRPAWTMGLESAGRHLGTRRRGCRHEGACRESARVVLHRAVCDDGLARGDCGRSGIEAHPHAGHPASAWWRPRLYPGNRALRVGPTPYFHFAWHLCVLAGTTFHYFAVRNYAE